MIFRMSLPEPFRVILDFFRCKVGILGFGSFDGFVPHESGDDIDRDSLFN